MIGALDAMSGNLNETSAKLAAGARELKTETALERLSPAAIKRLAGRVALPAGSASPPAPATTAGAGNPPKTARLRPVAAARGRPPPRVG
jgi:hypothetical protein